MKQNKTQQTKQNKTQHTHTHTITIQQENMQLLKALHSEYTCFLANQASKARSKSRHITFRFKHMPFTYFKQILLVHDGKYFGDQLLHWIDKTRDKNAAIWITDPSIPCPRAFVAAMYGQPDGTLVYPWHNKQQIVLYNFSMQFSEAKANGGGLTIEADFASRPGKGFQWQILKETNDKLDR